METNKYYTPSIEEFHVGFEFEEWENPAFTNEEWIAKKIEYFTDLEYVCIPEVDKHLENYVLGTSLFRVKRLDKQDLVELGFEEIGQEEYYLNGDLNSWCIEHLYHQSIKSYYRIDDGETQRMFLEIKNKSELIKVLKMLGIK